MGNFLKYCQNAKKAVFAEVGAVHPYQICKKNEKIRSGSILLPKIEKIRFFCERLAEHVYLYLSDLPTRHQLRYWNIFSSKKKRKKHTQSQYGTVKYLYFCDKKYFNNIFLDLKSQFYILTQYNPVTFTQNDPLKLKPNLDNFFVKHIYFI